MSFMVCIIGLVSLKRRDDVVGRSMYLDSDTCLIVNEVTWHNIYGPMSRFSAN